MQKWGDAVTGSIKGYSHKTSHVIVKMLLKPWNTYMCFINFRFYNFFYYLFYIYLRPLFIVNVFCIQFESKRLYSIGLVMHESVFDSAL